MASGWKRKESFSAAESTDIQEAPMVPNKAASLDQPVFMMRLGAKFIFQITIVAGSKRGWVPLAVTGPVKMRIGFARSDEGDTLEVGQAWRHHGKLESHHKGITCHERSHALLKALLRLSGPPLQIKIIVRKLPLKLLLLLRVVASYRI